MARPPERKTGQMIWRHKGSFASYDRAVSARKRLTAQGKRAKVVRYTDGFSLYIMASHEFWGKSFIHDRRR